MDTPSIADFSDERDRLAEWRQWRADEEEQRTANIKPGIYGMEPIPPLSPQIVYEGMAVAGAGEDGGEQDSVGAD